MRRLTTVEPRTPTFGLLPPNPARRAPHARITTLRALRERLLLLLVRGLVRDAVGGFGPGDVAVLALLSGLACGAAPAPVQAGGRDPRRAAPDLP